MVPSLCEISNKHHELLNIYPFTEGLLSGGRGVVEAFAMVFYHSRFLHHIHFPITIFSRVLHFQSAIKVRYFCERIAPFNDLLTGSPCVIITHYVQMFVKHNLQSKGTYGLPVTIKTSPFLIFSSVREVIASSPLQSILFGAMKSSTSVLPYNFEDI